MPGSESRVLRAIQVRVSRRRRRDRVRSRLDGGRRSRLGRRRESE